MLGYIHQARYSLYLLLQQRDEFFLAIEKFDDVSFHKDGTPFELLQLKHHCTPKPLTDTSTDLWKTIRIWCEQIKNGACVLPGTIFTLVTTSTAQSDSIAASLSPLSNRNAKEVVDKLLQTANKSENKSLKEAFDAFTDLTRKQQEQLVDAIQILDGSPNINDTAIEIQQLYLNGIRREKRLAAYERLEGLWLQKVITHLSSSGMELISCFEVRERIADIAQQFTPDALPIDFLDLSPQTVDANADDRQFVEQLKAIALGNRYIEKAIQDYYRAFTQRSKWVRDELLFTDELETYDKKLADEWDRFVLRCTIEQDIEILSEEQLKRFGQHIFFELSDREYYIRPKVTEPYVMRGSYHILADKDSPPVYWHPKFLERLKKTFAVMGV